MSSSDRHAPLVRTRARVHRLADGTEMTTRPIERSDATSLVRLVADLSDESSRRRFFTVHHQLSDTEVQRFTHVDHHDREAYVALVADELIGVGRYDRATDPLHAEVAFTVADAWQDHGVATVLLQRLAEHAATEGICTFVAEVLADNRKMLDVFEHAAPASSTMMDYGVLRVEMPIAQLHAPCGPRP